MSLRVFIGGVRGSRPVTGGVFSEFGGETTSLLVVSESGSRLVLDAGTGLTAVAEQLQQQEPGEVTILFSHYHLDHLMGLTMNPLLYQSDWSFHLVGPVSAAGDVRQAVTGLLAMPYWPVTWEQMAARITFADFTETGLEVGDLTIRGCAMPHPNGSTAYRIEEPSGSSLVFATDVEWQQAGDAERSAFMSLCQSPRPADVLLMDAHFQRHQAQAFAGWGHTCGEDVLDIAAQVGIQQVLLGHHAPEADDAALRSIESQLQQQYPGCALARSGWVGRS